jgi:molecular chaperone GrpE
MMSSENDLPPLEIVEAELVAESELGSDATPDPAALGIELPREPDEAVDVLLRALAASQQEADSYLDDLRRVAADFDNFRKRAHREQSQLIDRASERVLLSILPVLDSFDAAVAAEPQTEGERRLLEGMRATLNQLLDALAREGLEVIPAWGEPFDPNLHEAVASSGDGTGKEMVSQELRRGYRLGSRVIRPALVTVESTGSQ